MIKKPLPDNLKEGQYPCEYCGDYEYCAGHYDDAQCTGYIPGNYINPNIFNSQDCSS